MTETLEAATLLLADAKALVFTCFKDAAIAAVDAKVARADSKAADIAYVDAEVIYAEAKAAAIAYAEENR